MQTSWVARLLTTCRPVLLLATDETEPQFKPARLGLPQVDEEKRARFKARKEQEVRWSSAWEEASCH